MLHSIIHYTICIHMYIHIHPLHVSPPGLPLATRVASYLSRARLSFRQPLECCHATCLSHANNVRKLDKHPPSPCYTIE